ncbi:MAG: secretion protein F [Caulobacterales bacterium 68-7]|nr:type II secretion system F family protein [Caulobacterales bacterium]OJU09105.1 MAG: secretion protein F [Caulobacterales bacterium 68-7]
MIPIAAAILLFITIAGLGFAFAGGDSQQARTLKRAQALVAANETAARARARVKSNTAVSPEERRKQIVKTLRDQEKQAKKASLTMAAKLQQAGLAPDVRKFWIISGVLGLVVAGAMIALRQTPLIALGAGFAAGLGLPRWVIGFMAKSRFKKFTANFSDAIDIIVRGIKSGLPVHDCLKMIGRELPQPLAGEFVRLTENMAMGMTTDQALEKMFERMPTPEVRFFAIVLAIQQKSGGNLAEALGNLSAVLRARRMMREKIKAMSSEAVTSAFIIGSLPPAVVVLITVTTPGYMAPMFSDPRGHLLLLVAGGMMSMGVFVMRKMINFKI